MFRKKSKEKITKMDVLITSVVLGTIVAWAFWLKKRAHKDDSILGTSEKKSWFRKIFGLFLWK